MCCRVGEEGKEAGGDLQSVEEIRAVGEGGKRLRRREIGSQPESETGEWCSVS